MSTHHAVDTIVVGHSGIVQDLEARQRSVINILEMQRPVRRIAQRYTMDVHVLAVVEDDHGSRAVGGLNRSILDGRHRRLKGLGIANVLRLVVVSAMRCIRTHERIALSVDLAAALDGDVTCILGDEHAQHNAFAGYVHAVVPGKTEGRARQVLPDIVAADQRCAGFQVEPQVALQLHRADGITTRRKIDRPTATARARVYCGHHSRSVRGRSIPLSSVASYIADSDLG